MTSAITITKNRRDVTPRLQASPPPANSAEVGQRFHSSLFYISGQIQKSTKHKSNETNRNTIPIVIFRTVVIIMLILETQVSTSSQWFMSLMILGTQISSSSSSSSSSWLSMMILGTGVVVGFPFSYNKPGPCTRLTHWHFEVTIVILMIDIMMIICSSEDDDV